MNKNRFLLPFVLLFAFVFNSCSKGYLDVVPSSHHQLITGLDDLQKLLDKDVLMNSTPSLPGLSDDDYYVIYNNWLQLISKEKNAYIWSKDIFGSEVNDDDWNLPYEQVEYANTVLDYLAERKIADSEVAESAILKGEALFKRAFAFYNLSQVFMQAYDRAIAENTPGIPLRLHSDINEVSTRASMQQTYDQIINDLREARLLVVPGIDSVYRNHASVPAVMALMCRVYLSMREYDKALLYADSCLGVYDALIDYNDISTTSPAPFTRFNKEAIYQARVHSGTNLLTGLVLRMAILDSTLAASYASNDLRKNIYFLTGADGLSFAKGSYYGNFIPFTGLATDEVLLTRAECRARKGNVAGAMQDLNLLLEKRSLSGTFVPLVAQSAAEALQTILTEVRKELVFRGQRWTTVRRLNKDGAAIIMKRVLNGHEFSLLPNDPRYALPIPPDVINKTGMQQNPR